MIKNSHQYSTTKSPVIHQLLQEASRSHKKPQEASRSPKKPQEATRSLKKPQEASRSLKKPQEASRSHKKPQCPATRTLLCLSAMILMLSTAS